MAVIRETSFNTKLADVLRSKHPRWRENGMVQAEAGGILPGSQTPDIFINLITPLVIECEFAPANTVEEDAKKRLGVKTSSKQVIEQAIALRVPEEIKGVGETRLEGAIRGAGFEYCLLAIEEEGAPIKRWPEEGWLKGGVDDLAALIEHAGITERLIRESLETLEGAVFAAGARLVDGVRGKPDVLANIAKLLCQSDGLQTTRMAMAILSNAITFHRMLGEQKEGVKTLRALMEDGEIDIAEVAAEWERIVKEVNYFPVFDIASKILGLMPDRATHDVLTLLEKNTRKLFDAAFMGAQDIYGRMFQRLITDRKFLATFYTLPESAQLLAEIAVDKLGVDFGDAGAVQDLRIADFACGTGTLISAAYNAVLARYRRAGGDDAEIHSAMVENSVIATDIMPAGVHLTLSVLASAHPAVIFGDTRTSVLSYGKAESGQVALGALDLIQEERVFDLLHQTETISGAGSRTITGVELARGERSVPHANCDLVIMNPPFTRPTNHEITDKPVPSFAGFGTSEEEQHAMSARLKQINAKLPQRAGHGNAGLASNFIDVADKKLKAGGVLALVLPSTFASGHGWLRSREFINANYDDITLISLASTGTKTTAFSADTAIAEILLIAKKREKAREEGKARVQFVSLRKRPASPAQAGIVAREIVLDAINKSAAEGGESPKPVFGGRKGKKRKIHVQNGGLWTGLTFLGEVVYSNLENGGAIGVLDNTIIETAIALKSGVLRLPSESGEHALPITRLGEIAERGLLHRDINGINPDGKMRGPFNVDPIHTPQPNYLCLWNHDSERERCFVVEPDCEGEVRHGMQKQAKKVWETRTTLHFNLDFGLSANSLAACVTPMATIGGVAWPNVRPHEASHESAIVLWANCSLGLLLWWLVASRQQAGRSRMTISHLPKLPMLDTRKLTEEQHEVAGRIFERFKGKGFLPANEVYHDEVRHALDRAVLVELLGLPEEVLGGVDGLRRKWCNEPSVHGGKRTRIGVGGR